MFVKEFRKNGMPCPDFKKDVMGGISSVRTQIINGRGVRKLKVIKHDRTALIIRMFAEHCFLLDSLGNLTEEPDDSEVADIGDSIRYQGQNLFKAKRQTATPPTPESELEKLFIKPITPQQQFQDWNTQLRREIEKVEASTGLSGKSSDGNIIWNFGTDEDDEN
jgi:hypothetical protein